MIKIHDPDQVYIRNGCILMLIKLLQPYSCTRLIIVSIFWYDTAVNSGGVQELTESPFGYERSWIRWKEPLSFFGTRPKGEQIKLWNGPLILPFWISLLIFWVTTSGLPVSLLWFWGNLTTFLSKDELILKPDVNPWTKLFFKLLSYPSRNCASWFTFTGVGRLAVIWSPWQSWWFLAVFIPHLCRSMSFIQLSIIA